MIDQRGDALLTNVLVDVARLILHIVKPDRLNPRLLEL